MMRTLLSGRSRAPGLCVATALSLLSGPVVAMPSASRQVAQLGDVGRGGPSYGYQPYNDRNPTGFYHPGGMGFGHYYLTQKQHGHRFRAFGYRKFKGT